MILTVAVGLAAGLGAVARYVVDSTVQRQHGTHHPYGTFVVNVSGSLLLGLVTGLALHHGLTHGTTVALATGLCGGYTTWSTFAYETLALGEAGDVAAAAVNVAASLAVGLGAAGAGLGLALL